MDGQFWFPERRAEDVEQPLMNKKELTEADIRTKFITPALIAPDRGNWDVMTQLREECFFTNGRVIVRGKAVTRGEAKKADYILYYKPNIPIAVIEAKDNSHSIGDGMQQALDYAEILEDRHHPRVPSARQGHHGPRLDQAS